MLQESLLSLPKQVYSFLLICFASHSYYSEISPSVPASLQALILDFPPRCSHLNAYRQQLSPPDFFPISWEDGPVSYLSELSEKSGGLGRIALRHDLVLPVLAGG